jgi:hypothetical protein
VYYIEIEKLIAEAHSAITRTKGAKLGFEFKIKK